MRICWGTAFRMREIMTLERVNMTITDSPMPTPLATEVVTARVEHIPNSCTSTGFWVRIPSFNCLRICMKPFLP